MTRRHKIISNRKCDNGNADSSALPFLLSGASNSIVACRLGVSSTHRRDYFNNFVQRLGVALISSDLSQLTLEARSCFVFESSHPVLSPDIHAWARK
jgi:hypothetical protein